MPPREELAMAVDEHRAALKAMFPLPPPRAPRRKQAAVAGAVLALLVCAGLWWLDPVYHHEEFATRIGQIVDIQLADASHVVLDTNTRLNVQWRLRSRRMELAQGRAHFDVAHSSLRPLFVDAGPAQVRVVGTHFDVWRQTAATQVSVYQGKVAVWRSGSMPDSGIVLTPLQQTTVSAAGAETLPLQARALENAERQVWRQGRLVFSDTPLDEVIATLQRYRSQPLTLSDRRLAGLTVSGVFDAANIGQLLAMLPETLPVALRRTSDGGTEIRPR
ncbi:FecR domain-containing protein [Herbaspirillum lusitanum]|uniref:FecR domain-containing protein n=1 Tax=Herbaspirillum lusitanum TaxID=213312 RepID=A0ABW9A8V3_9BURK